MLWLGCVDASSATAKYNLDRNRSLLIYIGGEKEQLMTEKGKEKIFVKSRKGFIKLALQYGAHLVPMVRPSFVTDTIQYLQTTEFITFIASPLSVLQADLSSLFG